MAVLTIRNLPEKVRDGLKDILLVPAQLYEALRQQTI